jgi:hypothetical protein
MAQAKIKAITSSGHPVPQNSGEADNRLLYWNLDQQVIPLNDESEAPCIGHSMVNSHFWSISDTGNKGKEI